MKKDKWLIAVTAGRWQVYGIKRAKELGYKIVAIDGDKNAEGFAYSDVVINIDISDINDIVSELKALSLEFCGAVSFCSEAGMLLCAEIREEFNLPGPNSFLTKSLINKKVQREIWRDAGVAGPAFSVFSSKEDCLYAISNMKLPCIVKPVDSAGSRGVSKISSGDSDVQEKVFAAFKFSKSGEVIVEEYMDGTEFTVETFCDSGGVHVLCVTEKKKIPTRGGVVAYELATSGRSVEEIGILERLVIDAFKALKYVHGPGHAEVILMKDGRAGMVEAAGRGGGFNLFNRFIPLVSNYDLVGNTVRILTGEIAESVSLNRKHGVLRFFPSKAGIIKEICGFDVPIKDSDLYLESFVKVGQMVADAASDGDRLGCVIAVDENLQNAFSKADKVSKDILFQIEAINESH